MAVSTTLVQGNWVQCQPIKVARSAVWGVKQAGPQGPHLREPSAGFNTFAILKFLVIFEQGACNFLFNWASQIITELRNIVPFTWWT